MLAYFKMLPVHSSYDTCDYKRHLLKQISDAKDLMVFPPCILIVRNLILSSSKDFVGIIQLCEWKQKFWSRKLVNMAMRQRHYRDLISYENILCKLCKQSLVKQGIKMKEILHLSETNTDTIPRFYNNNNNKTQQIDYFPILYIIFQK